MRSVALMGRRGSGKTTIARHLAALHGYRLFSWAEPVRVLMAWAYDDRATDPLSYADVKRSRYVVRRGGRQVIVSGRELLQRIGTEALRDQVDEDFWVRVGLRRLAESDGPWANDDTRFANELAALRELGWVAVWLDAPEEVRRARLHGEAWTESANHHASEEGLGPADADVVLDASRPVGEVLREVVRCLR